jgi:hypothetical protein
MLAIFFVLKFFENKKNIYIYFIISYNESK